MKNLITALLTATTLLPGLARAQGTVQLTEEERMAFNAQVLEKSSALGTYLSTISNKSETEENKDDAERLAINLFVDENRRVEVSSKNSGRVLQKLIGQYLTDLRNLPYSKVVLTWSDVVFIQDLKLGTDGKYYAHVTIRQRFIGMGSDGLPAYEDITDKDIEVVMEKRDKRIGDRTVSVNVVLLGDIAVTQTS